LLQYTLFIVLAPVAAIILSVIAVLSWRRRRTPPGRALFWLCLATLGWIAFNTLELAAPSPSATFRWAKITYPFIAAAPLAWLAFALQYVGRREWLSTRRLALLGAVPLVTSIVAQTSDLHTLLWRRYEFVPASGFLHMRPVEYGPWFWVHLFTSQAYVLLGAGLILAHYVRSARLYRRQSRWVVLGAAIPIIVNFVYVFDLVPGWTKDYSPLGVALAGLLFSASIWRHRLLDLWPIGRDQLVESMTDAVIVTDRDQRVVDANPAAYQLISASDGELIGRPVDELLPPRASSSNAEARGAVQRHELSIERENGPRLFELQLSDLADDQDRPLGQLIVLRDVTERSRTLERLRRQERLAAIGQLAGGIAHDFNNLLGSITLHAQLAQRAGPDAPVPSDHLTTIVQESERAAELVDQILDFGRSQVIASAPLDLGPFVEEVAAVLRRTIREDIELLVEGPAEACVIDADPTRIQQVLLNLATNARDAMPDGGRLRIGIERCHYSPDGRVPIEPAVEPEWARLTVADDGEGMDEETKRHIFEPFYTTKQPDRGTGLGLAQVYGIVKQHRGHIEVQSAQGEGTTFTIYLPLIPGNPLELRDTGSTAAFSGDGETILIVEDAAKYREAIRDGLEALNYRVLTAGNGAEALALLSRKAVDLVITDLIMPEMGGRELAAAMREEACLVPSIAMTGYALDADPETLKGEGFREVIFKPFAIEDLSRVVRYALDVGSH